MSQVLYRSGQIVVKLDKTKLQMLTKRTKEEYPKFLDKFAFDIAGWAKRYVPVDTGATKASIYVEGANKPRSTYLYDLAQALSTTLAIMSGRRHGFFSTDVVGSDNEDTRIIGASTWYATIVERTNKAFLRKALDKVRPGVEKAWREMFFWAR